MPMWLLRAMTAFRDITRSWQHLRTRKPEEHGGQLSRTATSTQFGIRRVITTIQSRHCSISWLTGWSSYDSEEKLEQLTLNWFQDTGWEYRHGPDIAPDCDTPERTDYRQVLLQGRLHEALHRLNPDVSDSVLEEVLQRVAKLREPSVIQSNRRFHETLLDGVPVEVEIDGVKRGDRVRLMDFERPENNLFLVVNQFTAQGTKQARRPDLVCFINGIPIAVIELKNTASEQADIWSAFRQLETYKAELADFFVFNEALVISDGLHARVGSLTADRERFLPWRTIRNENDRPLLEFELEKVVRGFFAPELLLDYLRYFILYEQADDGLIKKIAG